MASKHHPLLIDGEPNESCRRAFAADAVDGRDEITKAQFLMIRFHDRRIDGQTAERLWGLHPM
jgi:hypothetical protein